MRKVLVAAGWAWATAIVWLSLTPTPLEVEFTHSDKAGHLAAYALLMFWFSQLYTAGNARLAYAVAFISMGVALEFLQDALGYRSYDLFDMAANALGVLLGWAAAVLLKRPVFP